MAEEAQGSGLQGYINIGVPEEEGAGSWRRGVATNFPESASEGGPDSPSAMARSELDAQVAFLSPHLVLMRRIANAVLLFDHTLPSINMVHICYNMRGVPYSNVAEMYVWLPCRIWRLSCL